MTKSNMKKVLSDKQKIGLGVGLTAAAVAAAGTFFLYGGKGASKNRKTVKSWVLKAKAEVLEKLEGAKEMTKDEYDELVSTIAKTYITAKTASKKDLVEFSKEMKDNWKLIEKAASPLKKAIKKSVKKVVPANTITKKAVKKAVTKK